VWPVWALYDSSLPLFEQFIGTQSDSFVKGDWISSAWFYVSTRSGHTEVWKVDTSVDGAISQRINNSWSRFCVSSRDPKLLYAVDQTLTCGSVVAVTVEGLVVTRRRYR
jgi:hypothetical protein